MTSPFLCVDASLIVRLVTNQNPEIFNLWQAWEAQRINLVAPTLIYYEVVNALYQYERHSELSSSALDAALSSAFALPLRLHGDPLLHRSALQMTRRYGLPSSYDAHYLALAERLDTEFWTSDRRLANAVRAKFPRIRLLD